MLSIKPKQIRKSGFLTKADYVSGCDKCEEYFNLKNLQNLSPEQIQRMTTLDFHKTVMHHQQQEFKMIKESLTPSKQFTFLCKIVNKIITFLLR